MLLFPMNQLCHLYLSLKNVKVKRTLFILTSGANFTFITLSFLKTLFHVKSINEMLRKGYMDSL